ncbi:MAG: hypothetical protein AB7F43_13960 [Bacteriovoracia bacterium]
MLFSGSSAWAYACKHKNAKPCVDLIAEAKTQGETNKKIVALVAPKHQLLLSELLSNLGEHPLPEIRQIYSDADIKRIEIRYSSLNTVTQVFPTNSTRYSIHIETKFSDGSSKLVHLRKLGKLEEVALEPLLQLARIQFLKNISLSFPTSRMERVFYQHIGLVFNDKAENEQTYWSQSTDQGAVNRYKKFIAFIDKYPNAEFIVRSGNLEVREKISRTLLTTVPKFHSNYEPPAPPSSQAQSAPINDTHANNQNASRTIASAQQNSIDISVDLDEQVKNKKQSDPIFNFDLL